MVKGEVAEGVGVAGAVDVNEKDCCCQWKRGNGKNTVAVALAESLSVDSEQ